MKYQIKGLKKAIILLVVVISIASCGKEIYSCDPEANMWVKSNIVEIQQMTRTDFLVIGDIVYQRAAFNAFTPEQRQALWIGKMEEVLTLDWTEQERQHIQNVQKLIKVNSFIFSNEQEQEAFEKVEVELYKWIEYAKEELIWDKELLHTIIATPQKMNADKKIDTFLKATHTRLNKSRQEVIFVPKCECSSNSDWCGLKYYCNDFVYCEPGNDLGLGCGTLWLYRCNGICGFNGIIQ